MPTFDGELTDSLVGAVKLVVRYCRTLNASKYSVFVVKCCWTCARVWLLGKVAEIGNTEIRVDLSTCL